MSINYNCAQSTGGVVFLSYAFFIALLMSGCEPRDERPGMWLAGEDASALIKDWRFTDSIDEVFVETQTRYLLAHSTTIWCAQLAGQLYIGSYGEEWKGWENNMARDPQVKLRIENKIYHFVVTPVTDEDLDHKLTAAYAGKYDMQAVFGEEIPVWRYYKLEQQL